MNNSKVKKDGPPPPVMLSNRFSKTFYSKTESRVRMFYSTTIDITFDEFTHSVGAKTGDLDVQNGGCERIHSVANRIIFCIIDFSSGFPMSTLLSSFTEHCSMI